MGKMELRSRKAKAICGVTAAAVVVGGAGAAFGINANRTAERIEGLTAEAIADGHRLARLDLDLAGAVEHAATLLADTEGKVADDAVRQALAAQIATTRELIEPTADHTPARDPEFASIKEAEQTVEAQDAQIKVWLAAHAELSAARQAVIKANAAWTLAAAQSDLAAKRTAAESAIADAEAVLAEADGKVTDNATRDALAGVVAALRGVLDLETDAAVQNVVVMRGRQLDKAVGAVNGAKEAVAASRAAWQEAENARIAAAEAAAKAQAEAEARAKAEAERKAAQQAPTKKATQPTRPAQQGSKGGSGSTKPPAPKTPTQKPPVQPGGLSDDEKAAKVWEQLQEYKDQDLTSGFHR